MPQEIGYAAAYEAYRQLRYNSNVYSNGYTDYERQRETQRALAIAEGVSLQYRSFLVSHASRHHHSLAPVARRWSWDGPIRFTDGMRRCCGDSR